MAVALRLTSSLSAGGGRSQLSEAFSAPRFLSVPPQPCLLSGATCGAAGCSNEGRSKNSRLVATRIVIVRAGDVATTPTGSSAKIDPLPLASPEKVESSKMEVTTKSTPKDDATAPVKNSGTKTMGKKSVEKPLASLMSEDIIPALQKLFKKEEAISDVSLIFEDNQLQGSFVKNGIPYSFWAYFPDGKLDGSRGFSLSAHGSPPSTVEPFLIDERKIDADLIVFWVMKRLFAQNILSQN